MAARVRRNYAANDMVHHNSVFRCKTCGERAFSSVGGRPSPRGRGRGFCRRCYFRWYVLDAEGQADFPKPFEDVSHFNREVAFAIANPELHKQREQAQREYLGSAVEFLRYKDFWARRRRRVDQQFTIDLTQDDPAHPALLEAAVGPL